MVGRPPYKRSTPVARLRRNVEKLAKNATLVADRLEAWRSSTPDPVLESAHDVVRKVQKLVKKLDGRTVELESNNFMPPKHSASVSFEPGQDVMVVSRFRRKYELVFEKILRADPDMLDGLVVVGPVPSTGEVVVRRGRRTPFVVCKTHIVGVGR